MLFNGVQSLYSSETVTADANCNLPFIANYNTANDASQVPGQLVIDHEGQLTVPSALSKVNSEEMETGQPTAFGLSNNSSSSFDFSKGKRKCGRMFLLTKTLGILFNFLKVVRKLCNVHRDTKFLLTPIFSFSESHNYKDS